MPVIVDKEGQVTNEARKDAISFERNLNDDPTRTIRKLNKHINFFQGELKRQITQYYLPGPKGCVRGSDDINMMQDEIKGRRINW